MSNIVTLLLLVAGASSAPLPISASLARRGGSDTVRISDGYELKELKLSAQPTAEDLITNLPTLELFSQNDWVYYALSSDKGQRDLRNHWNAKPEAEKGVPDRRVVLANSLPEMREAAKKVVMIPFDGAAEWLLIQSIRLLWTLELRGDPEVTKNWNSLSEEVWHRENELQKWEDQLSQPGESAVRKAVFDRSPNWEELAAKVEVLFKLQRNEVGLSYVDSDGDSVTISTNEELSDFYAQNNNKTVKFTVTRLVPRAPSVAQVPDTYYPDESPEPVIVEDQDWGGPPRREGMLGALPVFSTVPPNVLNSMQFGFIPGDDGRAATPAFSEARIEEIPSEQPSRTQSVDEETNYNRDIKRPASGMARPMGGKGKEKLQRPVKGRQITDLSAIDDEDEAPKDPRSKFNINARAQTKDSIYSEAGSDVEDPGVPPPPRVAPNAAHNAGGAPPSIYDDIADVITALSQVLIRAADGSYLQPQKESALNMANGAAKVAIEDSARRVTESLEGVLRTLDAQAQAQAQAQARAQALAQAQAQAQVQVQAAQAAQAQAAHLRGPTGFGAAGFGMGAPPSLVNAPAHDRSSLRSNSSSTGRPRPSSMFGDRFAGAQGPPIPPPPFGRPPREEPMFQTSVVSENEMPPPFVPPTFPSKFNPQTPRGQGPAFASTPGSQQPRGLFSDALPAQAPRPMNQERSGFSGGRFQPAAGPLSSQTPRQGQQPTILESLPEASAMSPISPTEEELARQEERERLESARQLYKQEKANFRAQREAERLERVERKARREKGGPEASQLIESLEAAFGQPELAKDVEVPQPVRPSDLPGLFAPPTHGHYTVAEPEEDDSWENPPLPKPQPWQRPMRGPNHEQNERLIARLADMGFAEASQPQLPNIVRQQTKNNLGKSDDELIERILEVLISADGARPTARAGPSTARRK
ncbi:hypothetical protein FRB98_004154 [Tulasnella sp. 332]|nr:hypothetical protein FRB98_004154 [Tulasnella sp. 332]